MVTAQACSDCGSLLLGSARLLTTCQLRCCPTCARFMANAARVKAKELILRIPRESGYRFYGLHMTTRFDPSDPDAFTIDALRARCQVTKGAAKYVWTRVLKQAGAGFIAALEVAPGGMVHVHAIYFGPRRDIDCIRAAWLEKIPDSPQMLIEELEDPETRLPELFKYMMKLSAASDDEEARSGIDPRLAARVEIALSGKRRVESYGVFRKVKLEEPPEEETTQLDRLHCEFCDATTDFRAVTIARGLWIRDFGRLPRQLTRVGPIPRGKTAEERAHNDRTARERDPSYPVRLGELLAAAKAHFHCAGGGRDPGREPQDGPRADRHGSNPRHPPRPGDSHPTFGGPQTPRAVIPSHAKQARDVPLTE